MKYLKLTELSQDQIQQYKSAINKAFPRIIQSSLVIKNNWGKIEKYFPDHQLFLINNKGELIGFINTVPIFFSLSLFQLPNEGWDWLVHKSINDHQNKINPNTLGGLQVIVPKPYQGQGYSKLLIKAGKDMMQQYGYKKFVIPIRPTLKKNYPDMSMIDYLHLKKQNKIYDPWIRTHVNSDAKIISVCHKSMRIHGDLRFWEDIIQEKINYNGDHYVEGALNPVYINKDNDKGEYYEENIWIAYE